MKDYSKILRGFGGKPFSRLQMYAAIKEADPDFRQTQVRYVLGSLLDSGSVIRVSRNQYIFQEEGSRKEEFDKLYSATARKVIGFFRRWHKDMDFRIWELCWLDEFLKDPVIKNKIFLEVEDRECERIFSLMSEEFENLILIRPSHIAHHRKDPDWYYNEPDYIIISPLHAETPRGKTEACEAPLEKIIVDMFSDKPLKKLLAGEDYAAVLTKMFGRYVIDEQKMFRYARRRNREELIRRYIREKTDIELLKES